MGWHKASQCSHEPLLPRASPPSHNWPVPDPRILLDAGSRVPHSQSLSHSSCQGPVTSRGLRMVRERREKGLAKGRAATKVTLTPWVVWEKATRHQEQTNPAATCHQQRKCQQVTGSTSWTLHKGVVLCQQDTRRHHLELFLLLTSTSTSFPAGPASCPHPGAL